MRTAHLVAIGLLVFSLACRDVPRPKPKSESAETADAEETSAIVIRFGVVARAEPRLTVQGSQPLIDHLSEVTPYRVEPRVGRSSEDFELDPGMQDLVTFLEERLVEIAPLGVLSYCLADDRFGAVPLVQSVNGEGEPRQRAAFVTASSSGVAGIRDLQGKSVALGPSHSMVSHVLGLHELDRAGTRAETSNFESESAVLEAVRTGQVVAGVVAERVADDSVRVIHLSGWIPSPPIVVRADLPEPVQSALATALLELEPGTATDPLFENGFLPGRLVDYGAVREMLNAQSSRCTAACHEPVRFGDRR